MLTPILLPVFIALLLPIFVAVSPSCIRPRLVREIPYRRRHAEHLLSSHRGAPHFPWNHVLQRGNFLEPVKYSLTLANRSIRLPVSCQVNTYSSTFDPDIQTGRSGYPAGACFIEKREIDEARNFSIPARIERGYTYRSGLISTIVASDEKFVEWSLNLLGAGRRW